MLATFGAFIPHLAFQEQAYHKSPEGIELQFWLSAGPAAQYRYIKIKPPMPLFCFRRLYIIAIRVFNDAPVFIFHPFLCRGSFAQTSSALQPSRGGFCQGAGLQFSSWPL